MRSISFILALSLVLVLALALDAADGAGICFGGGYPACCANGKNSCGPFCASCARVGEFLANMNMFSNRGEGSGTPDVFRVINTDPFSAGRKAPQAFPTNFGMP